MIKGSIKFYDPRPHGQSYNCFPLHNRQTLTYLLDQMLGHNLSTTYNLPQSQNEQTPVNTRQRRPLQRRDQHYHGEGTQVLGRLRQIYHDALGEHVYDISGFQAKFRYDEQDFQDGIFEDSDV